MCDLTRCTYLSEHEVLCGHGVAVVVPGHASAHPGVAGQVQVLDHHGGRRSPRRPQRDAGGDDDLHVLRRRVARHVPPQHHLLVRCHLAMGRHSD
jgi:hypothetical protein